MLLGTPERLEYAILKASDVIGREVQDPEPQQDFRDDSPFAQDAGNQSGDSVEYSVYWLHERGYTFNEIYGLLVGEIETLSEGFAEEQERRDQQQNGDSGGAAPSYGNKGDRAAQLGWR